MSVLKVLTYGNPLLRKKAEEVKNIDDEVMKIIKDLEDTFKTQDGIGLAAPQIGISKRIILVDLSKSGNNKKIILINPKYVYKSVETEYYEEGCLSIPGVWGKVERPKEIKIKGQLINGKTVLLSADGIFARVLQHEMDHLDGKLFIDYLSRDDLQKNKENLEKILEENRKLIGDIAL